jgi:WD40 repeat protein
MKASTIRLWDLLKGSEIRRFEEHKERIGGLAVSSDGRYALSAGPSTVVLWDLEGGAEVARWSAGSSMVAFLPDARFALLAGGPMVRLWRLPISRSGRVFRGAVEKTS